MPSLQSNISLYLHIPFCVHRCAYCDFNTYAGQEAMIPAYIDALTHEIDHVGSRFPSPSTSGTGGEVVHTIFFGGGTPSLLSVQHYESILRAIRDHFMLTDEVEITMEANPGTVSYERLLGMRQVGVNRISYGVQSSNTEELHLLERAHNFFDVIEAVTSARKAGFHNLNLDLIYGLPEQTLTNWQTTVKRILGLQPEHISAYALTLEHGTPFGRWASRGLLPLPDPDLAAEMYEWLSETLEASGYLQYEISNWARPGHECRHNLQYWRGLPYLAFGAGAHGYANGYRYSNVLRIKTYIDRLTNNAVNSYPVARYQFPITPATVNHHKQSLQDDMSEFMLTGLRLVQRGVSAEEFQTRFGRSMWEAYGGEIEALLKTGLLEKGGEERIRLTRRGRLLGNQVFARFV
jgi:oxygen-independent coproporphyrinogen III oxidase